MMLNRFVASECWRFRSSKRIFDVLARDFRIDLCRSDPGVAQDLLDGPEVCSLVQEMLGEGMAQLVNRQTVETSRDKPFAHQLLGTSGGESPSAMADK